MADLSGRRCHRCGTDIGSVEGVGRRDACLSCRSDLHCCRNCRFYSPGQNNDCMETQAERQVDKAVGNFCDYFSFRVGGDAPPADPGRAAREKLAGLFKKPAPPDRM